MRIETGEWFVMADYGGQMMRVRMLEFLPRTWSASEVVLEIEELLRNPGTADSLRSLHEVCAERALRSRVTADWNAEVPGAEDALVFGAGSGLSSGATMFYRAPVVEEELL